MKPVILLIDDEEDLVAVLADAIDHTMPAYRALRTTSAEDAEALLSALGPDSELRLVCVDHRLGGRTGLDFLEGLAERFPGVPAILFTGQAPPQVEERAQRVGARVLWKPIRLSQWLGEVQSLLASPAA